MIFYTSGVFFDPSRLLEGRPPILGAIFDWHPLHNVLSISRGILLEDHQMPVEYWFNFSVWAVVMVSVGTVFFWKAEERYGRAN
jgi:teichoic acid transport system permease protein